MSNHRVHIEAQIEMEERLKNIFYFTKKEPKGSERTITIGTEANKWN